MKKIRIKFICFGGKNDNGFQFNEENNFISNILKKHYEIEYSENPDYLFYGDYGDQRDIYQYDCVRIYLNNEYVVANFNICDYALGLSHLTFEDRYFRYLPYTFFESRFHIEDATRKVNFTQEDLKKKDKFCAFVHANGLAKERNQMFELLSGYKEVSSGGRYRNNIGGFVKDKKKFYAECKFAMAFENSYGFDSDRLVDTFASKTIPIYWGDPHIGEEFNTKAFINAHEYETFEQVLEKVKEIDENDEAYIKMMKEPLFNPDFSLTDYYVKLENFLIHIFDQELEKAYRRNRSYWGIIPEKILEKGTRSRARRIFINKVCSKICRILHLESLRIKINSRLFYYQKWKKEFGE